jgi:CheY-like chemotaxis protein
MMNLPDKSYSILIADDDAEDRMLLKDALEENQLPQTIHFVENGEELLDYLFSRGKFTNRKQYPLPGLILLDLNMPKKDGREALKIIKETPHLRRIPVVVLTTSKAEEDILNTFDLGVSAFITKPTTYTALLEMTKTITKYWFELVERPT